MENFSELTGLYAQIESMKLPAKQVLIASKVMPGELVLVDLGLNSFISCINFCLAVIWFVCEF